MPATKIVMYARERYFPDVQRSRHRLNELELDWIEHDIESDQTAAAEVERLTGKRRVPTLVIGDAILVEPSNRELDEALTAAGHKLFPTIRSN